MVKIRFLLDYRPNTTMDTSVAYEMSKSSDENSTFCAMEITPILNFVVTTNQWNMEKIMENFYGLYNSKSGCEIDGKEKYGSFFLLQYLNIQYKLHTKNVLLTMCKVRSI